MCSNTQRISVSLPLFTDSLNQITPTTHITLHIYSFFTASAENEIFFNICTVFLTAMRMRKLRKAHCSPPHWLLKKIQWFPLLTQCHYLKPLMAGKEMTPLKRKKPFHFPNPSDGKQIFIYKGKLQMSPLYCLISQMQRWSRMGFSISI